MVKVLNLINGFMVQIVLTLMKYKKLQEKLFLIKETVTTP